MLQLPRRHLISAAGLAMLSSALPAFAAPAVGQAAPNFTLKDTAGRAVSLAEFKGKHVVLEWVNPSCPYVRKHYGSANMQGTQREVTGKGVVWLTINSTEEGSSEYLAPAALGQWMSEQKAAATRTLLDAEGTVGQAYGARTTPHLYIIDPQGKLIYAGGIDSVPSARVADIQAATNYVKQGITQALAGQPLTNASTRPYGCSVKYKSAA